MSCTTTIMSLPLPPPSDSASNSTALEDATDNAVASENNAAYACLQKHRASVMKKRKAAEDNLRVQAKKMLKTSNEKFTPAKVGDTVRVKVPDVDRGSADPRNILAVITVIEDSEFYWIGNEHSTLKQLFTRSQFTLCPEKLRDVGSVASVELSVRQAASAGSSAGGQGYQRCNCTKKCTSALCACKKKGILCNSECHNSGPCCNK